MTGCAPVTVTPPRPSSAHEKATRNRLYVRRRGAMPSFPCAKQHLGQVLRIASVLRGEHQSNVTILARDRVGVEVEADDIRKVSMQAARVRARFVPAIDLLPQLGMIALLDGRVERVHVEMEDDAEHRSKLECRLQNAEGKHFQMPIANWKLAIGNGLRHIPAEESVRQHACAQAAPPFEKAIGPRRKSHIHPRTGAAGSGAQKADRSMATVDDEFLTQ